MQRAHLSQQSFSGPSIPIRDATSCIVSGQGGCPIAASLYVKVVAQVRELAVQNPGPEMESGLRTALANLAEQLSLKPALAQRDAVEARLTSDQLRDLDNTFAQPGTSDMSASRGNDRDRSLLP